MQPFDYHTQADWRPLAGHSQSPVSLAEPTARTDAPLTLTVTAPYRTTSLLDVGTTIRLPGSGRLTLAGRTFDFVQAHWHAPVEHPGAGAFALECHLVHQSALGQPLVVALLLPLGAPDPVITAMQAAFHRAEATPHPLDLTPLWPAAGTAYRYAGSLTTPPLTEGVEWCVLAQHARTVSATQVAWFTAQFGATARAPQPLNGRPLLRAPFTVDQKGPLTHAH